jgi:hypothetical protein
VVQSNLKRSQPNWEILDIIIMFFIISCDKFWVAPQIRLLQIKNIKKKKRKFVYILIIKKGKIFCRVKNKIKFVGVHATATGTDQLCRGAAPIFSIILIRIK